MSKVFFWEILIHLFATYSYILLSIPLQDIPPLVLANKQDLASALSTTEVAEMLELHNVKQPNGMSSYVTILLNITVSPFIKDP